MNRTFKIGIFLAASLLTTQVYAGKLDALFDQESGTGSTTRPASKPSKQGKASLDALMQQEQAQEDDTKRQQEQQQRQQQQRAEQRRQSQEAERERQDDYERLVKNCQLSKSGCEGSCMGVGLGGALMGSRSSSMESYNCQRTCEQQNRDCLEAAENNQRLSPQVDPAQAAMRNVQQELNEKQQREQAERERRERQQAEQNEAERRRIETNNRYYENKNRQDAENYNRQQQAANQQRQQQQRAEQEREHQATEQRRHEHNPANDARGCVGVDESAGHEFGQKWVNNCGFPIEISWCLETNDGENCSRFNRTATIRANGRNPIKDGFRIQGQYRYEFFACKGANSIECPGGHGTKNCRCPDYLQK